MTKLWIAFIVLATLGSVYPFNFQLSALGDLSVGEFVETCCVLSSRGDILGNIILFMPVGFTGMLAGKLDDSVRRRLWFVCLIAATVAVVLQLLQIFLPSRDENLQDVIWNIVGAGCGAAAAIWLGSFFANVEADKRDFMLVPLTLVGIWIMYRLFPFVPSIDLQMMARSVKPMLNEPLVMSDALRDFTAWIVVAYLLSHVQRVVRLDSYLPAIILAVFILEIVTVFNSISLANVVGAFLAAVIWAAYLRHLQSKEVILIALLVCTLVLHGLAPFELRADAATFSWLPFQGFLHGSMLINAQSAAAKVFLYGSLVYLLWGTRLSLAVGVAFGFSLILAIEFGQTQYVGHTPEITDPLLVVFAALALLALDKRENTLVFAAAPPRKQIEPLQKFRSKKVSWPMRILGNWVTQETNLRTSQYRFLQRLGGEMDASVSRVVRRIVKQFMADVEKDDSPSSGISGDEHLAEIPDGLAQGADDNSADGWMKETINLQRNQYRFLQRLSDEMNCSASRVIRRIVDRFIDSLEEDEAEQRGSQLLLPFAEHAGAED